MDRGAWQATVCEVAQSGTELSSNTSTLLERVGAHVHAQSCLSVATQCPVAHQAPLSTALSRPAYRGGGRVLLQAIFPAQGSASMTSVFCTGRRSLDH